MYNCSRRYLRSGLSVLPLALAMMALPGCGGGDQAAKQATQATQAAAQAASQAADAARAAQVIAAAGYRSRAASLSSAAGIAYRFGNASTASNTAIPTYWKPADQYDGNGGNGAGWDYQVGSYDLGKDDYSSNHAQAVYVPDAASDPGMDDVLTLQMGQGNYVEKPQLVWEYYGGGHPDVQLPDKGYIANNGGPLMAPVAVGRPNSGWSSNDLVAFQSGLIAGFGTSTSNGGASVKLPPNKVPSAITVTSNNEFALVTVWDTDTLKGQVAVLALGTGNGFWGDWFQNYPGLRNYGLWSFIKVIGYVDLPGINEPTSVSASCDHVFMGDPGWMRSPDGNDYRWQLSMLDLNNEVNRQSFIAGGPNAPKLCKAGFAVVGSRAEHKAIVLDLAPLFAKAQQMYFTSRDNFVKTQTVGQLPTQWPYTFDIAPDFAPKVVKTLSFDQPVTAVKTSMAQNYEYAAKQVYVATEDGNLHVFSAGGYADGTAASPDQIVEVGSVMVGRNPTSIAQSKHTDPWAIERAELIVLSREEKAVRFIRMAGATPVVIKTLRDSRLVDPVWVDDNDNHGTESYLLTIADYGGKQVANYRYGPVVYWTNGGARFGMGSDGNADFEFGGAYPVTGHPFQLSGANVP